MRGRQLYAIDHRSARVNVRSHTVPGPKGYPFLGVLPGLRRNALRVLVEAEREYGDVVCLRVGAKRVYLLNHPDHVKRILQDNSRNYRLTPYYEKLRPLFGHGLLTSEGDLWNRQRVLVQPALQRHQLEAMMPLMTAAVAAMLEGWKVVAAQRGALDVAQEMIRLTLGIVARTMFGAEAHQAADDLGRTITFLLEAVVERTMALTDLGERLPTPRNRRFRDALRALDDFVSGLIDERRRGRCNGPDLLSVLLEARERDGSAGMGETVLHDQVKTMLVSGSVTTSNALTWTWYLLSQHPETAGRLDAEIDEVLGGCSPAVDDLRRLRYARMVIQEALRLFPPTWRLARMTIDDDEFGGYRIAAGSIVVFSPYLMHRHPGFWQEPDHFAPERFAPEAIGERPRFAYFPFSGGPRACIGAHFAMMEMQVIVSMVAQRFRLRLVPGHPIDVENIATLRPRHGLRMTLEERPSPSRR